MHVEVDLDHLPPFPKRIPEKLKTIREHLGLTPDEIAPKTGAKILAYENDEDDLLVSVLWGYARLSGNPLMNLLDDNLEVIGLITIEKVLEDFYAECGLQCSAFPLSLVTERPI